LRAPYGHRPQTSNAGSEYDHADAASPPERPEDAPVEIGWLEDFLAVVDQGGFSRAAESRHVTQSALSRRIQALEEWVGAPLFNRTTHKVFLSPAGEAFRLTAEEILRRLEAGRLEAREQANAVSEQLQFASTNALALTFFPVWLRKVEASLPFVPGIQLVANHMEACERLMLQGRAQFLLGHHHPAVETLLTPKQFLSHCVGNDTLIPVCAPACAEGPGAGSLFELPGSETTPIPYLSYRTESGMGRIVTAVRGNSPNKPWLKPTFSSHLAKLLVTMALDGRGMAWLPESLIRENMGEGSLVRAGGSAWDIPIEIHVFRSRARLSQAAELFWTSVTSTAK
jgi:DNA-binding transcriptional LysR family regulator